MAFYRVSNGGTFPQTVYSTTSSSSTYGQNVSCDIPANTLKSGNAYIVVGGGLNTSSSSTISSGTINLVEYNQYTVSSSDAFGFWIYEISGYNPSVIIQFRQYSYYSFKLGISVLQ